MLDESRLLIDHLLVMAMLPNVRDSGAAGFLIFFLLAAILRYIGLALNRTAYTMTTMVCCVKICENREQLVLVEDDRKTSYSYNYNTIIVGQNERKNNGPSEGVLARAGCQISPSLQFML